MFYIVISLIIIGITQGFILVEEELLIIIASIVWVDAAGKLIKDLLVTEVEYKGVIIKEKYLWFLLKKTDLDKNLILIYNKRILAVKWFKDFQNYILVEVINNSVLYYLNNNKILKLYTIMSSITTMGLFVLKEIFSIEISYILNIINNNSVSLNKYTTVNYLMKPIGNIKSEIFYI